jgi:poly-gamma-glutamate synthesis protein (capsule biosynthesis protein)
MFRAAFRALMLVGVIVAIASTSSSAGAQVLDPAPAYRANVTRLPDGVRALMSGSSWRPGCPVGLDDLRLVRLTYRGFDGEIHWGRLVVHRRWAKPIASVFQRLFEARFPIHRMRLVDRYGADDMRSMKADNTSAFNCRYRNGVCCTWSEHAYGRAIDINPVENPYVGSWGVSPPDGEDYVDRSPIRRGMLARRDAVWWAFHSIGWEWGGDWTWPIDYQHFSATGR